jgi:hypothetical protein
MNRIHSASVVRCVSGRVAPRAVRQVFERVSGLIPSRVVLAASALAASTLPAIAQDELRLPRIEEPPTAPRIWMYALTLLLLAAIIFAASFKSKRTHQD